MKKGLLFFLSISGWLVAQEPTKTTAITLEKEGENIKKIASDTATKPWKIGGTFALTGQQVSLTNWAAGGQNSISGAGLISLRANYHKNKSAWDSNLDLAYGVIKQGENRSWWKNDDRIQLTSKYGYKAFKNSFYTALLDFKTQFADGYNYPNDSVVISRFLSPGYVLAAIGLDYKPSSDLSVFVAPVTAKITLVYDQTLANAGAFGVQKADVKIDSTGKVIIVKKGLNHREEFGGYLKFTYSKSVMENVKFSTMLELFSNYLVNPQNIDVNWTTLTTLKVNKYISANISTHLIYDHDIQITDREKKTGPRTQFKEVFGLGFTYSF